MSNIYKNIYDENQMALDPRAEAARRRAAALRAAPAPEAVPSEEADAAQYDEEGTGETSPEEPDAETGAPAPAGPAALSPGVADVLGAGVEDPAKAAAMARAKMLLGAEEPQGRMVGPVYVAPSFLQNAAYGLKQVMGMKEFNEGTKPGPDTRKAGAMAAMGLTGDEQIDALLMSPDPGLQRAGMALLGRRKTDAAATAAREAERRRYQQQIDLEAAKQGGREALIRLRASTRPPPREPQHRPDYSVAIGPQGAYRVDRRTGEVTQVELPFGPPRGAAPGSPEAKAAEATVLEKMPADVRTKYQLYDWQSNNLPAIIRRVQGAPAGTFGPGTDVASFVPGQSFSAIARTWQDKGRTPEQITARRAVFSDAYTKIKELAGTAVTESEGNRLREFLPNGNDTPEAILAKLQGAYEEASRQRADLRSKYLSAFPESPAGGAGAAGSAPAPAPTGAPRRVTTEAEYNAVPSGARYIDSDGNERTKR